MNSQISSKTRTALYCAIAAAILATAESRADTNINTRPVAANDSLQRFQNFGLKVQVATLLANDTDPDNHSLSLNSVSTTSAAGGTVIRTGNWISYEAAAGFTNADSFSYVIADSGGLRATGSVSIAILTDFAPSKNIVAMGNAGGVWRIEFLGVPGRLYTIQYTESLEAPDWRPLGIRRADSTGKFELTDPRAPGLPPRFYRSTYP